MTEKSANFSYNIDMKYKLFIFQIFAHLSIIPMILYSPWWGWLISIIMYMLGGGFGMSMTYHRLLSHKSWKCPKYLEKLFVIFATLSLTGPAIGWVAIHRQHHNHTDTKKDPHSPSFKGWFYSHFLSMFEPVNIRYAVHLLRDKFYLWQHKWYFEINIIWAIIITLIFMDPMAVIYAWLFPAMLVWNAGSLIVSTSHRNKKPHNDIILALISWGEGYHNNHHNDPKSYRFGKYDISSYLIDFFKKI